MALVDRDAPDLMTGVKVYGPKDCRLSSEIPVPVFEDGGALIKVTGCGICAGDAKIFEGAPKFWGDAENAKFIEDPVILGHEFVGEVVEISEKHADKYGLQVGDQVTSEQLVPCNQCFYCQKGLRWLCEVHDIYGCHQVVPGGFAQYMAFHPNSISYKIRKSVEPKYAAYVEPLSCAVHGVERGKVELGDTAVVSGCGAIGLGMIATLKRDGLAHRIIALDCIDSRLDVARAVGADVVLNPRKTDVVKEVKDMCGGYGCDVYFEASGAPPSVTQGILMTRKAARFVEFSVFKDKTTLDWSLIGDTKELDIYGGHCSGDTGYKKAIEMLESGYLPVENIVTHYKDIHEYQDGLNMVTNGGSEGAPSIKVVLNPWAGQ